MRTKRKNATMEPGATAFAFAATAHTTGQAASMALAPAAQLTATAAPAPIVIPDDARHFCFLKLVDFETKLVKAYLYTDFNIPEYLLTANNRDWRKYWETAPGGVEEALVQLKMKFDEKKCNRYVFNVDLFLPPVYFDLVQCLLENAKPFTGKLPDDATNIVILSRNWESYRLSNMKVKKLAMSLFWWPDDAPPLMTIKIFDQDERCNKDEARRFTDRWTFNALYDYVRETFKIGTRCFALHTKDDEKKKLHNDADLASAWANRKGDVLHLDVIRWHSLVPLRRTPDGDFSSCDDDEEDELEVEEEEDSGPLYDDDVDRAYAQETRAFGVDNPDAEKPLGLGHYPSAKKQRGEGSSRDAV